MSAPCVRAGAPGGSAAGPLASRLHSVVLPQPESPSTSTRTAATRSGWGAMLGRPAGGGRRAVSAGGRCGASSREEKVQSQTDVAE